MRAPREKPPPSPCRRRGITRRRCNSGPIASRSRDHRGRSTMPAIRIDRGKPLAAEPRKGHNRYHPDIEPAIEVDVGQEVVLECRDALDGQITPRTTVADLATVNAGAVHPLTGPVHVKGAEPGDMLEIEFLDIVAERTAFSAIIPGLGFLRDVMTEPFLVHWRLSDGWATSDQ